MSQTIFLSTVTKEYGSLRKRLAGLLTRTKQIHVRHQDEFVESGDLTLLKLKSEIEKSQLVLHVIGSRAGAAPPVEQVEALLEELPRIKGKTFEETYSEVAELARDREITYTQWEAWIGLFLRVRVLRYVVKSQLKPEESGKFSEDQKQQIAHLERLRGRKVYPAEIYPDVDYFGDDDKAAENPDELRVSDDEQLYDEMLTSLLEVRVVSLTELRWDRWKTHVIVGAVILMAIVFGAAFVAVRLGAADRSTDQVNNGSGYLFTTSVSADDMVRLEGATEADIIRILGNCENPLLIYLSQIFYGDPDGALEVVRIIGKSDEVSIELSVDDEKRFREAGEENVVRVASQSNSEIMRRLAAACRDEPELLLKFIRELLE